MQHNGGDTKWVCAQCTMGNHQDLHVCEVCANPRGNIVQATVVDADASGKNIDEHVTAVGDDEVSRASHATFSRDFDVVAIFT
jgi:hypothetical protein